MQTYYYIENICVSSELHDLKDKLLEHVSEEPEISDEVKERLERKLQEITESKAQVLHDEIELRRELGQFIFA